MKKLRGAFFKVLLLMVLFLAGHAAAQSNALPGDKTGAVALHFSSLGAWKYSDGEARPPAPLQQMSGKMVKLTGFMYPLEEGRMISVFCLLRSTQTCCYGPKPQYNQYVFVEMKKPVKLERNKAVIVTGKFFIDPSPEDGFIYRLEGKNIEAAPEQKPDSKLGVSGKEAIHPIFDFTPLEGLQPPEAQLEKINSVMDFPEIKTFPEVLSGNEGKLMTVEGYIVGKTDNPLKFVLGKYWWDGCCTGVPPTFFNAVIIMLRKGEKIPDDFQETCIITGTLRLNSDRPKWPALGIARLEDASIGLGK